MRAVADVAPFLARNKICWLILSHVLPVASWFTLNDIVYDEKFGEQCSTIKLDDRLKRYPPIPFYIGRNAPNAWMGIKNFFKGEIAIVKFWN